MRHQRSHLPETSWVLMHHNLNKNFLVSSLFMPKEDYCNKFTALDLAPLPPLFLSLSPIIPPLRPALSYSKRTFKRIHEIIFFPLESTLSALDLIDIRDNKLPSGKLTNN